MKETIKILESHNVYFTIKDGQIVIDGGLFLDGLTSVPDGFLHNTTIDGGLYLDGLTSVPDGFLQNTTIDGGLYLNGLTSVPDGFLQNTTIGSWLYLNGLTSVPDGFLHNTTIGGGLYLDGLTSVPDGFLQNTTIGSWLYLDGLTISDRKLSNQNVNHLETGYNTEKGYCYFDRILRKVTHVSTKKDLTIYTTPFGMIVQKGEFTAHGKDLKSAVSDLKFKISREKLKSEPIYNDTIITVPMYRAITGACKQGVDDWIKNQKMEINEIKAEDLLPLLEKTNAYGLNKFKELLNK